MSKNRYLYIDNLRLVMIILVVMVHLAVTYSGIGSWAFMDVKELDTICMVVFALFQTYTQAYFMGFLFLISGYFVVRSYDKKGSKKFLADRFIRLGLPTLLFMLIISPFIQAILLGNFGEGTFLKNYFDFIVSFNFLGASGPLWFAFALLIFNLIYCLIRVITKNKQIKTEASLPGIGAVVCFILIISICTFLVRLVQPIGTNVVNMQLCFFPQYIALFIVGVKAGRYDWFSAITYKMGKKWLLIAFIPGILLWVTFMVTGGALDGNLDIYMGGCTWQSAVYSTWESLIGVAMSIGLIGVFREKFNHQSKLTKALSDSSFGVYVFHAPVIITVSILLYPIVMYPLLKFAVAALIGIPVTFALSYFVFKRIPLLKKIL